VVRVIFLGDLDLNDYFAKSIIVFIPTSALVFLYIRSRIKAWGQGVSS
jgi:hypothetical protein